MTDYGMRKTKCKCGHEAVEHYDSQDFCTWTLDGECDCEQFAAAGPEVWVTWSAPGSASAAADEGAPEETWFNKTSAAADEPGEG